MSCSVLLSQRYRSKTANRCREPLFEYDKAIVIIILTVLKLFSVKATPIKVRLAGSAPSSNQGRVEVDYNGTWGTICDSSWDTRDAHVVCRMLGYSHSLLAKTGAEFGLGSGPALLDNVNCGGSEATLLNCTHDGWGVGQCEGVNSAAGVVCDTGNFFMNE